ncbi:MAG: transposase, partial [Caldivirga sp.]|nr:transposase [Caldivirga sp.]
YIVDVESKVLILKDFNLEIKFVGRLRWFGRQGRLEMHYDEARNAWYACIPVEVGVEEAKTGKKSKHIVKGERRVIQIKSPKGNKAASIDLGINNLASVVVSDGTWILYKGIRAKEDYFYFMKRIAEVQSLRDTLRDKLLDNAIDELNHEMRRLYGKLMRRLLHLYRNHCAYHGIEVERKPRGVVHCPMGHKLHSDLNGALNIMRRAIGKIPPVIKKPLSFIVEHNRVAPIKGR